MSTIAEKPKSEKYRPELIRLPELSIWRKIYRWLIKGFAWLVVKFLLKVTIEGREYFPETGPVLIVSNHLGDADGVVGLAYCKVPFDVLGKVELYDIPVFGKLLNWYGAIWVHRGRPDRRAIRAVLKGLSDSRMIAIAPEGRESLTGALEEGTDGAAYIALKSNAPVFPIVLTGTENNRIYRNLKELKRTKVTIKAGPQFHLQKSGNRRLDLQNGTQTIMKTLAQLLPPEYQGIYRDKVEKSDEDA
jgi:1-acyl-sn-glycerol-3-phosphate acyltransferase